MDPTLVMGAATAIGGALATPPAGPSSAYQGDSSFRNDFDGSGWNISFGSGGIESKATKTGSDPLGLSGMAAGFEWQGMALVALGGVALWLLLKRKR